MGTNSKIEWCDHTWNPWIGCTRVSPGCDHCYAERYASRFGMAQWGANAPRRRTGQASWKLPLAWNADAVRRGVRHRVFVESLGDFFDNEVPDELRLEVLQLLALQGHLDPILLTKRIGNAERFLTAHPDAARLFASQVWLGVTAVNQEEADRDIPRLLHLPARVRFVSMEPLLGLVRLGGQIACGLDWVIVGGESGPQARPMHPGWARSIRDECARAWTPFFFKQWGEWNPFTGRVGKAAAGRLLDGVIHGGVPSAISLRRAA
ncbi:Gp37Gp68 family protein [Burkholderiales bacterium GJ-E10]|nr:Gp37Gp68 family protein [Burkholderiales bacterium GJ-E10]